jgi:glycerate kinase
VRALCCPDKFRGSLTAPEAAAAMARGLRAAGVETRELPLADGGEGTLDALDGERRTERVTGPLGERVEAEWSVLRDGTAVVEMALASGLALVAGRNDPVAATTRGTGELIAIAIDEGATRVVVGVGGSATTDGGLGAVEALGWSLGDAQVIVACDVETRFVDAARVFGPQKGATPADVDVLTRRLEVLAERYLERTGLDVRALPHAGAAGGLAGGLAAIGAELRPGFDVVADTVGFRDALAQADLVVTGEGRLDETSLAGKVVGRVLARAAEAGIAAAVIAGHVAAGLELPANPRVASLEALAGSPEAAVDRAAELVERAARGLA